MDFERSARDADQAIAFYAPLKSPDDPVPSGERTIARLLMLALSRAGFNVQVMSNLRSLDMKGDPAFQGACFDAAMRERDRIIQTLTEGGTARRPHLWCTYHNYYKAPDLIGPAIADALNIPYVVVEGTRAKKRLNGPWARFAEATEQGLDRADLIYSFTDHDEQALRVHQPEGQLLKRLSPLIDQSGITPRMGPPSQPFQILTVAMMRHGAKRASYDALVPIARMLSPGIYQWTIVGDGPARDDIEAAFAGMGLTVRFAGACGDAAALRAIYRDHDVFVWPGIDEAIGMVYLEAQAHGLPTLAHDRIGPRSVLPPHGLFAPQTASEDIATELERLATDPQYYAMRSDQARFHVAQNHDIDVAVTRLTEGFALL
ncbi:MAG: glycosyltransferase family 4 protein [Pseudomonadota bacterium]